MSDNNSTPESNPSTNQPQQPPTPPQQSPRIPIVPPEQLISIAKSLDSTPLTKK